MKIDNQLVSSAMFMSSPIAPVEDFQASDWFMFLQQEIWKPTWNTPIITLYKALDYHTHTISFTIMVIQQDFWERKYN